MAPRIRRMLRQQRLRLRNRSRRRTIDRRRLQHVANLRFSQRPRGLKRHRQAARHCASRRFDARETAKSIPEAFCVNVTANGKRLERSVTRRKNNDSSSCRNSIAGIPIFRRVVLCCLFLTGRYCRLLARQWDVTFYWMLSLPNKVWETDYRKRGLLPSQLREIIVANVLKMK